MVFIYTFYKFNFMQIKLIFMRNVLHEESFPETEARGNSEMSYWFSIFFFSLPTTQDHNGSIGGAELDALIRDLYIKNNKVEIPLPFKYCSVNGFLATNSFLYAFL